MSEPEVQIEAKNPLLVFDERITKIEQEHDELKNAIGGIAESLKALRPIIEGFNAKISMMESAIKAPTTTSGGFNIQSIVDLINKLTGSTESGLVSSSMIAKRVKRIDDQLWLRTLNEVERKMGIIPHETTLGEHP